MAKIDLSSTNDPLFESLLTPPQSASTKGDDETIQETMVLLNKKNKVIVGKPKAFDIISKMKYNNENIPFELMIMKDSNDFYQVNLSCSFVPDTNCIISWATFGITLFAKSPSGEIVTPAPMAMSMFPDLVETEIAYKNEYSISVKLSFLFTEIGGEANRNNEYIRYEPKIMASGVNSSEPTWNFTNTREKSVYGNKHLMLLVQMPKNSRLFGRFFVAAEAKTKGWRSKSIPIVGDDEFKNIEYEIPTYG
jgi:hypothetical protein